VSKPILLLVCFCLVFSGCLISRAQQAALVVQTGHANAINAVAFSPDGKILASGSHDTSIKLWDVKTGIQFRSLRGHTLTVTSVVFDQFGRTLISASLDGTIRIWDISTGESVRIFSQSAAINAIALTRDGRTLASAAWDHTITLWDFATGRQIRILRGHSRAVNSVAFNHDGTLLASGSDDNLVRLWKLPSGKQIQTISFKESPEVSKRFLDITTGMPTSTPRGAPPGQPEIVTEWVNSVTFSPDGTKLATVSARVRSFDLNGMEIAAKLWDVRTAKEIRGVETFAGGGQVSKFIFESPDRNALIGSVAFSADGATLIGRGTDYQVKLWDIATGKTLHQFPVITFSNDPEKAKQIRERFERITWKFNPHLPILSPDGTLFAIAIENNISLWDVAAEKPVLPLTGQATAVQSIAFGANGKLLVTGSPALPTRVWDLTTGKVFTSLDRNSFPYGAMSVAISAKYDLIATATLDIRGETASIEIWDLQTGKQRLAFKDKAAGEFSVDFSPDGKSLVVGRLSDATSIWDANTGQKICDLPKTYFRSNVVAFSPNGKIVARTSWGGEITTIPQSTGSPIDNPKVKAMVSAPAKSPRFVDFFQADAGALIQHVEEPGDPYYSIAFSTDGTLLAAAGEGNTIDIWDVQRGNKIKALTGRHEIFYAVAFSPDKKIIAAGGINGSIYLCDTLGNEIGILSGHSGAVRSISFTPDGAVVASGSEDGTVKLWRVADKEEIVTLLSTDRDNYLAVTPANYYASSKSGFKGVGFRIGNHGYPFEQYDLKFNRPDLVLERLGNAPQALVDAYRRAHQERLERMNFTEQMLGDDLHLPEIRLIGEEPPISTRNRMLHFKVRATDSHLRLDRLNVYVNGVPIYGSKGINVRDRNAKEIEQDIDLELSDERNKIQISVLNEQGIESLKETFNVTYNGPSEQTNLYVLAVGVAHYSKDPANDLKYADKDARDQINFWYGRQQQFGHVYTKALINQEATKGNVLAARDFLSQAKVDDTVVVFFSGHGLLDQHFDYYFATAEIDFENPSKEGLSYEAIEGLLDGIPSRKKLLLIDTCHAGELDKDEHQLALSSSESTSRRSGSRLRIRALPQRLRSSSDASHIGTSHSVELLQELFADLRRGSGTQVIAAAGGEEFAEEGDDWSNGVFTYAVLEGLRGQADKDKDGIITVSELRSYVSNTVPLLTNGGQKPSVREENLELDFALVKAEKN
jgi:WD40 repeat protein